MAGSRRRQEWCSFQDLLTHQFFLAPEPVWARLLLPLNAARKLEIHQYSRAFAPAH